MAGLELFQRMSVEQVAKWLELHPFEIIRVLVADGTLPSDLRLDAAAVERVRVTGGLETWWNGAPTPQGNETLARALVRGLMGLLLEKGYVEPNHVRADNLFRGLDADQQRALRRSVNALIRGGVFTSAMSSTGLTVAVATSREADARSFSTKGAGSIDRLWDQD
ncbi:MAG: hypothetical protein EXR71_01740 [Myxococcales bacterium]|nr:hypothetical protein [Myxococcales bacterium]